MLEKIRDLRYQFGNEGDIEKVSVSFNDYDGNPNGNLNISFENDDGQFDAMSPKEIQAIAKAKILEKLSGEVDDGDIEDDEGTEDGIETEVEDPIEEDEVD